MDVFYEESAVNQNAEAERKKYSVLNILSIVCAILAILLLVFFVFHMPIGVNSQAEQQVAALSISAGVTGVFCALGAYICYRLKIRYNVSFDYAFVSGELRITKVFSFSKRKLVTVLQASDLLQIGDVDGTAFDRLKSDPMTKEVVCTPNTETAKDKFFMYILANDNGKKLYILECRETLLMHILRFCNRSVLESGYIMQEKKQK